MSRANPLSHRILSTTINPASRPALTRPFTTTSRAQLSPLLNLSGLATSRESQFLSKERGIPRTEYSPNLLLIRSSEVDPFAPTPSASSQARRAQNAAAPQSELPGYGSLEAKKPVPHNSPLETLDRLRPGVVHAAPALATADEPLKAQYRIAIANLTNELQAAKWGKDEAQRKAAWLDEKAKKAQRLNRTITVFLLGFASYVAIDVGYKMGIRNLEKRGGGQARQAWDARHGADVGAAHRPLQTALASGSKEKGLAAQDAKVQEVLNSATTDNRVAGSGWKDWFWASPQVKS